jgi:DNA-directed RNA polymerase sigma subunit (sigma70/sigma32)
VEELDKYLDEPLPSELTEQERKVLEMRRVADANRAAIAGLQRTAGMRTV